MQLTDRQTNAALQAIVLRYAPNFFDLSAAEKTSLGQATYWWFNPIVSALPRGADPATLGDDHWELIKSVAEDFIVGVIRHQHPEHRRKTDDEIKACISLSDVETQALSFLHLAKTGLKAAQDHAELQELADSLVTMDLDLELRKLVAAEA